MSAARPVNPPPAPPAKPERAPDDFERFAQAMRDLGGAVSEVLRLPEIVQKLAAALERSDEARDRLRGMVERNATRPRLTVRRDDLRAVLDELDAHRARLAAGGEQ